MERHNAASSRGAAEQDDEDDLPLAVLAGRTLTPYKPLFLRTAAASPAQQAAPYPLTPPLQILGAGSMQEEGWCSDGDEELLPLAVLASRATASRRQAAGSAQTLHAHNPKTGQPANAFTEGSRRSGGCQVMEAVVAIVEVVRGEQLSSVQAAGRRGSEGSKQWQVQKAPVAPAPGPPLLPAMLPQQQQVEQRHSTAAALVAAPPLQSLQLKHSQASQAPSQPPPTATSAPPALHRTSPHPARAPSATSHAARTAALATAIGLPLPCPPLARLVPAAPAIPAAAAPPGGPTAASSPLGPGLQGCELSGGGRRLSRRIHRVLQPAPATPGSHSAAGCEAAAVGTVGPASAADRAAAGEAGAGEAVVGAAGEEAAAGDAGEAAVAPAAAAGQRVEAKAGHAGDSPARGAAGPSGWDMVGGQGLPCSRILFTTPGRAGRAAAAAEALHPAPLPSSPCSTVDPCKALTAPVMQPGNSMEQAATGEGGTSGAAGLVPLGAVVAWGNASAPQPAANPCGRCPASPPPSNQLTTQPDCTPLKPAVAPLLEADLHGAATPAAAAATPAAAGTTVGAIAAAGAATTTPTTALLTLPTPRATPTSTGSLPYPLLSRTKSRLGARAVAAVVGQGVLGSTPGFCSASPMQATGQAAAAQASMEGSAHPPAATAAAAGGGGAAVVEKRLGSKRSQQLLAAAQQRSATPGRRSGSGAAKTAAQGGGPEGGAEATLKTDAMSGKVVGSMQGVAGGTRPEDVDPLAPRPEAVAPAPATNAPAPAAAAAGTVSQQAAMHPPEQLAACNSGPAALPCPQAGQCQFHTAAPASPGSSEVQQAGEPPSPRPPDMARLLPPSPGLGPEQRGLEEGREGVSHAVHPHVCHSPQDMEVDGMGGGAGGSLGQGGRGEVAAGPACGMPAEQAVALPANDSIAEPSQAELADPACEHTGQQAALGQQLGAVVQGQKEGRVGALLSRQQAGQQAGQQPGQQPGQRSVSLAKRRPRPSSLSRCLFSPTYRGKRQRCTANPFAASPRRNATSPRSMSKLQLLPSSLLLSPPSTFGPAAASAAAPPPAPASVVDKGPLHHPNVPQSHACDQVCDPAHSYHPGSAAGGTSEAGQAAPTSPVFLPPSPGAPTPCPAPPHPHPQPPPHNSPHPPPPPSPSALRVRTWLLPAHSPARPTRPSPRGSTGIKQQLLGCRPLCSPSGKQSPARRPLPLTPSPCCSPRARASGAGPASTASSPKAARAAGSLGTALLHRLALPGARARGPAAEGAAAAAEGAAAAAEGAAAAAAGGFEVQGAAGQGIDLNSSAQHQANWQEGCQGGSQGASDGSGTAVRSVLGKRARQDSEALEEGEEEGEEGMDVQQRPGGGPQLTEHLRVQRLAAAAPDPATLPLASGQQGVPAPSPLKPLALAPTKLASAELEARAKAETGPGPEPAAGTAAGGRPGPEGQGLAAAAGTATHQSTAGRAGLSTAAGGKVSGGSGATGPRTGAAGQPGFSGKGMRFAWLSRAVYSQHAPGPPGTPQAPPKPSSHPGTPPPPDSSSIPIASQPLPSGCPAPAASSPTPRPPTPSAASPSPACMHTPTSSSMRSPHLPHAGHTPGAWAHPVNQLNRPQGTPASSHPHYPGMSSPLLSAASPHSASHHQGRQRLGFGQEGGPPRPPTSGIGCSQRRVQQQDGLAASVWGGEDVEGLLDVPRHTHQPASRKKSGLGQELTRPSLLDRSKQVREMEAREAWLDLQLAEAWHTGQSRWARMSMNGLEVGATSLSGHRARAESALQRLDAYKGPGVVAALLARLQLEWEQVARVRREAVQRACSPGPTCPCCSRVGTSGGGAALQHPGDGQGGQGQQGLGPPEQEQEQHGDPGSDSSHGLVGGEQQVDTQAGLQGGQGRDQCVVAEGEAGGVDQEEAKGVRVGEAAPLPVPSQVGDGEGETGSGLDIEGGDEGKGVAGKEAAGGAAGVAGSSVRGVDGAGSGASNGSGRARATLPVSILRHSPDRCRVRWGAKRVAFAPCLEASTAPASGSGRPGCGPVHDTASVLRSLFC